MRLHVLTAVSRPENLPRVAESLAHAATRAPEVEVCWHWRFDLAREHVGGQKLKNDMLDAVPLVDWVWVLDDDTLAHEDSLSLASQFTDYDALIVSQQRTDGRVLSASRENVTVGGIDIGQVFFRRALIGNERIPIDYDGDGLFLQAVLADGGMFLFHPAALSLHNAISGVEVSV